MEIWKSTPYLIYEVSNLGRVRNSWSGRILKHRLNRGYPFVKIRDKHVRIHQLVIRAFHGPPPTPEHQCDHINRDREDNWADNLRWATPSENNRNRSTTPRRQQRGRLGCPASICRTYKVRTNGRRVIRHVVVVRVANGRQRPVFASTNLSNAKAVRRLWAERTGAPIQESDPRQVPILYQNQINRRIELLIEACRPETQPS